MSNQNNNHPILPRSESAEEDGNQKGIDSSASTVIKKDSNLGSLTKSFVTYMQASDTGTTHLGTAGRDLGISKRRLYDITNVLEGIGLIEKRSRNIVQWVGERFLVSNFRISQDDESCQVSMQEREDTMRSSIGSLYKEGSELDIYLAMMKKLLSSYNKNLYCTQSDILDAIADSRCHNGQNNDLDPLTLIIVRAPVGSTMDVSENESKYSRLLKQYQLRINNKTAKLPTLKIDVPEQHDIDNAYDNDAIKNESVDSSITDINDKESSTKKRKRVSIWDDEILNGKKSTKEGDGSIATKVTNDSDKFTSLPSALPGVSEFPSVDPIDIYFLKSLYDKESSKYVVEPCSKRIKLTDILKNSIIDGSILTSFPQTNVYPSIPCLAHERGISDFF